MTSIEDRQRVVIDLSVYNAISYLRRNPTAREVVNYLHASPGGHPYGTTPALW